jgi:NAD(P)-dependent dehydrogenase (short-subunit alcohol dehydrogenase family)
MQELAGKVAVVTGGGGGIGRAMGQRFAEQGMKVVLADVQAEPLELAVKELEANGTEAIGVVTDVTSYASVEALRDAAYSRFGAVHLVCNNAGIGAGAEGRMWQHELQDWRWAMGVNVYGVIHGINAFVPAMIAAGDEGHIVNTSSGNGGVSPLSGTPQYAVTKAAVVTLTECLLAQLQDEGTRLSASVLFPGPHMLRTGIFESWRSRTDEFAKERQRSTPYTTVEDLEKQMAAAGIEIAYTDPLEVADQVVTAVQADQFWILPASESTDFQITARSQSMLHRTNPDYLRKVPG